MNRDQISNYELKAVKYNSVFMLIMAASGLVFGVLAKSSAIILDGLFSTILFLTIILAVFIQKIASQPISYMYPYSKWRLDSLYILFKVLILIGILMYTLFDAVHVLVDFFVSGSMPEAIEGQWIIIYSFIKISAAVPSILIYKGYRKKVKNKSEFLKIEQKSVMIDTIITLAILIGFLTLAQVERIEPVADALILLFLSVFLLSQMYKELIHIINLLIGKRINLDREIYYLNYFNLWFNDYKFKDVHIEYYGKTTIVSLVCNYKGKKDIYEMHDFERKVKELMYLEFGSIYLQIYWDEETKPFCFIDEK